MQRYLIVIEKAADNYSAYCPDLPGCVATGASREDAEHNMEEAIQFHLQGLKEDKLPIPEPHSSAQYITVK
jgi:predicted RNase H-like HicB family nuclease